MIAILITIVASSVKFAMTFPIAILQFGFSFMETVLWTNVGGLIGIWFFTYLSGRLIRWWKRTFRRIPGKKKLFTRRNRRIVHIKQRYGLLGIAIATPVLFSIPVGSFLVVRYYHASRTGLLHLAISNLVWSCIYSGFYLFWDIHIFGTG